MRTNYVRKSFYITGFLLNIFLLSLVGSALYVFSLYLNNNDDVSVAKLQRLDVRDWLLGG